MTNKIREVKVITGANYGDEGKGVVSNYFTKRAVQRDMRVLNVLFNGGCQRGHTVNGHIFHSFGAGAIEGADTYYTRKFMVDPIVWFNEYNELGQKPKLIIHPGAWVVTPYDVMINQALERKRGDARHGSCGFGIFETRHRCEQMENHLLAKDLSNEEILFEKLNKIKKEYYPARCEELGIEVEFNPYMFDNFMTCAHQMMKCGDVSFSGPEVFFNYESIIFEGGQGLLLSEENTDNYPYLTPSITSYKGAEVELLYLLKNTKAEFEFCLVSRPYLTRHGAGPLPYECEKEKLSDKIIDETNMPNEWQGSLRFAPLNLRTSFAMGSTIAHYESILFKYPYEYPQVTLKFSKAITCLDQTDGMVKFWSNHDEEIKSFPVSALCAWKEKLYAFYGKDTLPNIIMGLQ